MSTGEPIEISPAPDLYVVEFRRHSGDLGVSVILPATCALMAKLEAWRLFPEHKRNASAMSVFNVEYAEIDWETGRCFVMKRRRAAKPILVVEDSTNHRKRGRREEGAQ